MDRELASRIAAVRVARRLTQEQLAAVAAISVSLLRKVERGARPATPSVLQAIAEALDVDPGQLTGKAVAADGRVHAAIPAIRRALDSFDFPDDGPVRPLPELAQAVGVAERWRLSSQYARLAQQLPPLVNELCDAFHASAPADRAYLAGLLTSTLRSLDAAAYKFGYHDLSARLIDLMHTTAGHTGDDVLAAAVAYVRTEVFFVTGNLRAALQALDSAAGRTASATPAAAAAYGALHMRAAVVASRLGAADTARGHLREARDIADRVAESVYYGTAFGPESVRVHEIAVAVELGDEQAALSTAADWKPTNNLPAERRSHYYLDLARAQLWAGRRESALGSLRMARQIAPQHVREHPQVRETVATLLRLGRAPSVDLVGFASWLRLT